MSAYYAHSDYHGGRTASQPQPQQPLPQEHSSSHYQQAGHRLQVVHRMEKPHLSASFYPGQDDYYDSYGGQPELVSPRPQRHMPELEGNIEEGLANFELEARNAQPNRMSSVSTISTLNTPPYNQMNFQRDAQASYHHTNASTYQNLKDEFMQQQVSKNGPDSPNFSPFPRPRNPGPNVPLSDDDKEEVLERARPTVLKSDDPELQLAWAQDALSWVEVASQYAARIQAEDGKPPRSKTPRIEHQLRTDAISIVEFLAGQHHPKAEFMRGMWLEFGKFGYPVDKKEAFLGYKRAAEKNYPRAEYRIGMQYESSNNSVKAVDHYQRGVATKDSASNYRLGMMTLMGQHGMPMNHQRGVDLIRYAAERADENAPQGAYVYGMLLARELPNVSIPDQFLPFDPNEAKLFIEKAAYLGFAKAQLKMAQAYELCQLGCDFEPALSLHYNALAARQGEAEADMAISKWFLCGYEDLFQKNEELAFKYARRAAATKMATAEFAMGYFYEIGMYVSQDLRESEVWYQMAADHGNKDALGRIESIKKNNTLSKKDHEEMAISRIRSQHGSQRGGRPERFKQKPAPMPSMAEDRIDFPDPRTSQANRSPGRPVSAVPYPEDDMIPHRASQNYGAPPYHHQGGLGPNARPGPQADRPSSAFGIRPLSHANTDGVDPNRPADSMRSSSSMGNLNVPTGRGQNPPGRNSVASGGWESPQVPPKQGYRTSVDNQNSTFSPSDPGHPSQFDQLKQNRLPKQTSANANKPQPLQLSGSYGSGPAARQDPAMKRREPSANQYSRPERGSSMTPTQQVQSPGSHRQDRFDSIASPASSHASNRPSPRTPHHTMSSQGHDVRPHSVVSPGPNTPSGPPSASIPGSKKQGPSTFEQMGIPAGKNENECAVM